MRKSESTWLNNNQLLRSHALLISFGSQDWGSGIYRSEVTQRSSTMMWKFPLLIMGVQFLFFYMWAINKSRLFWISNDSVMIFFFAILFPLILIIFMTHSHTALIWESNTWLVIHVNKQLKCQRFPWKHVSDDWREMNESRTALTASKKNK